MFNKYYIGGDTTNLKCEVNLNQPSTGFIQKSNPVSRFIRFQRGSELEKMLFPTDPRISPSLQYTETKYTEGFNRFGLHDSYEETKKEEVIVLQICVFGNDYMLAEYVFKKDIEV